MPPPGVDPERFMELRALCCATSLFAAAPAAKELNRTIGLFVAPKSELSLAEPFRVRRRLHIRSLVLLQRVAAIFKVRSLLGTQGKADKWWGLALQLADSGQLSVHPFQTDLQDVRTPSLPACCVHPLLTTPSASLHRLCAAAGPGSRPGHQLPAADGPQDLEAYAQGELALRMCMPQSMFCPALPLQPAACLPCG